MRRCVKRTRKPTKLPRADFAAQLLRALQQLHKIGVMHGDMKPANTLLRRVGTELRAIVSDMSSMRPVDEHGEVPMAK
jgi:serine/threonine protein kinase